MENKPEIRNFVIISHIDHGKSTLADRFLELTKTISKEKMRPRYLDMMDLEQEKGITIKMQPVRMNYALKDKPYVLNLIDTPGHVDFSYEVSRSLAAVESGILLVEALKGVQAQTISNLELAKQQGLVIIPAVNKIDLAQADVKAAQKELSKLLNISEQEVFLISAKLGTNVEQLLQAVVEKTPAPKRDLSAGFRALIFDSKYDLYKGVVAFVRVMDGRITQGQDIYFLRGKIKGKAKELGYFEPELSKKTGLSAGEIGYIATGIKEPGKVRVGDTITISNLKPAISNQDLKIEPLPGYKEPKPMVFASVYPKNPDDYDLLKIGLTKLQLNDPSLAFEIEKKAGLGRGFRCGFLGALHVEIISERLKREFGVDLIITTPSVLFKIETDQRKELNVYSAQDWPEQSRIKNTKEPWAKLKILCPKNYLGPVLDLLDNLEGEHIEKQHLGLKTDNDFEKILIIYHAPLREIITGFYSKLKAATSGFASMDYELLDYLPADLVKLDVLIAGQKQDAFSRIVPKAKADSQSRKIVKKIKQTLPLQMFSIAIQACVGGKVIARETIRARRKDVTAKLYGGDYTRKRKLLEKQKKGKKKLKQKAQVKIPAKVFLEIFKSE